MRVFIGISMTRKMFPIGEYTVVLKAMDVLDSFSSNIFTILTERAIINHWIVGVIINVKYRCEIHVNANTFAMTCNLFSQLIDQCIRLHCTHCHLFWKFKRGIQSHIKAPFRINTN